MADTDQQVPETGTTQETNQTPAEPTSVELRAMEEGWVPQEQWEGEPDQWRPAKEFLDRGELFKKIEEQNRTIKDFKRALQDLQSHHTRVREVEYNRALAELKQQKKLALQDNDAEAVVQIDDQIDLVKAEQSKLKQEASLPKQEEINPEFKAWTDKNRWYETDKAMKAYADALGRDLAMAGNSPSDVLKKVEQQVRQEFKHKFVNPNREKPGSVEGSTNKGGKSGGESYQLSDEERRVMQRFTRTIPGFSEKDYIEELKRVKGA